MFVSIDMLEKDVDIRHFCRHQLNRERWLLQMPHVKLQLESNSDLTSTADYEDSPDDPIAQL